MEHNLETDERPWGKWIKLADNETCTVKILEIQQGEILSYQSHKLRTEFWYLISGKVKVYSGPAGNTWKEIEPRLKDTEMNPGDSVLIERNEVHSVENIGKGTCRILEISRGEFRENDLVRWKDKYERL